MSEVTFTTKEMSKRLGVSAATVRNYIKDPSFMAPNIVYSGKQKRFIFTEAHLAQWKKRLEELQSE